MQTYIQGVSKTLSLAFIPQIKDMDIYYKFENYIKNIEFCEIN